MQKHAIGFNRGMRSDEDSEAIKKLFTPEFRNRLDAIIPFATLAPEVVGRVVDKFVLQLEAQLSDRDVTISLTDAARTWLADKGYTPEFGARPLARVIQETIKQPLAEELLFGSLKRGGHVKIRLEQGKLVFDTEAAAERTPPKAKAKKSGAGKSGAGKSGAGKSGGGSAKGTVPETSK